jgi:hypothetical protein
MSTHDVPGSNPINNDELDQGCWAEHDDGSLILVEGIESGKVVYSIFDLSSDPPLEYRDAMPEKGFKDHFSWDPDDDDSEEWLWHDKTSFPWDKVMANFKDGQRYPSVKDQISAANRVSNALRIKGRKLEEQTIADKLRNINVKSKAVIGRKGKIIMDKIQRAIGELRA